MNQESLGYKFSKKGGGLFISLILLGLQDYLFNSILYSTILYYLAGWKDLFVFLFISLTGVAISKRIVQFGSVSVTDLFYIKLLFVFLLLVIISFSDFFHNIANFRFYFLVIFFSLILSKLLYSRDDFKGGDLAYGLVISSILVISYAFYQSITISKPEDFWYWDHFVSLGFEQNEWDVFRDGKPRISSFFTSSLDFSLYLLACLPFFLGGLYFSSKSTNYFKVCLYILIILITLFAIFQSTVRSALIGAALMIVLFLFFLVSKKRALLILVALLSFILSVSLTFYVIIFGYTDDLSALGRLTQWLDFFELIISKPIFGLGVSKIGIAGEYWFDSFWINYFLSFGLVLGLIGVFFILSIYYKSLSFLCINKDSFQAYVLLPMYLNVPVFFYLFIFQSFARSPSLYLFFLTLFTVYSYLRSHKGRVLD